MIIRPYVVMLMFKHKCLLEKAMRITQYFFSILIQLMVVWIDFSTKKRGGKKMFLEDFFSDVYGTFANKVVGFSGKGILLTIWNSDRSFYILMKYSLVVGFIFLKYDVLNCRIYLISSFFLVCSALFQHFCAICLVVALFL